MGRLVETNVRIPYPHGWPLRRSRCSRSWGSALPSTVSSYGSRNLIQDASVFAVMLDAGVRCGATLADE
jgi:hypothetical protein